MSQLNLPHVKRHFVLKLSSGNKHGHTRTHPTDCVTRPLERSPIISLKTHCFDVTANIKSFRIDRRMASIGSLNAGGWAMRVGGRVVEGTWEREAKQQRLMGTLTTRLTLSRGTKRRRCIDVVCNDRYRSTGRYSDGSGTARRRRTRDDQRVTATSQKENMRRLQVVTSPQT